MATQLMSRGTSVTLMNAQAATGVAANDFRLPLDYVGARMVFQFVVSGTNTTKIEATLDGVNWVDFPDTNVVGVTSSKMVVSINQGIQGIRGNVTSYTSGAVSVLARLQ